jgi:hypothetical protein
VSDKGGECHNWGRVLPFSSTAIQDGEGRAPIFCPHREFRFPGINIERFKGNRSRWHAFFECWIVLEGKKQDLTLKPPLFFIPTVAKPPLQGLVHEFLKRVDTQDRNHDCDTLFDAGICIIDILNSIKNRRSKNYHTQDLKSRSFQGTTAI